MPIRWHLLLRDKLKFGIITVSVKNSYKKYDGFTIVELLIVIVVIGILAAIVIVAFNGVQARARTTQRISDIQSIQKLILAYHAVHGKYPTDNTSNFSYQRRDGDAFIPGLVPEFAAKLPSVIDGPVSPGTNNTYAYQSMNGSSYILIRLYQPSVPTAEWDNVPSTYKVFGAYTDRWGVKGP